MNSASTARIIVVDDDPKLLQLLEQLLSSPTCAVETVQGANGLTPELLALAQPQVVLISPQLQNVTPKLMVHLIGEFRRAWRARVILLADVDQPMMADFVRRLQADAGVQTRLLVKQPLVQLAQVAAEVLVPPRPPASDFGDVRTLDSLDAEEILDLDVVVPDEEYRPPPPPLPPRGPTPAQREQLRQSAPADLFKLIEEELAEAPASYSDRYEVVLNTMTEHNLVAGRGIPVGLFVAAAVMPPLGTRVQVEVTFPWGQRRSWVGRVAWMRDASTFGKRRSCGFGVELESLTEEDKAAITRFAALRAPMLPER